MNVYSVCQGTKRPIPTLVRSYSSSICLIATVAVNSNDDLSAFVCSVLLITVFECNNLFVPSYILNETSPIQLTDYTYTEINKHTPRSFLDSPALAAMTGAIKIIQVQPWTTYTHTHKCILQSTHGICRQLVHICLAMKYLYT